MTTAFAPGRVNLIGDHVDYAGGLVLPMALRLGTTVAGDRVGDEIRLVSTEMPEPAVVPLDPGDPAAGHPPWARLVAGVVAELRPTVGFRGTVTTTLPIGSGLSSSAALAVAVARALGGDELAPRDLAHRCQRAEQRATGVPCGLMDQLVSVAGLPDEPLLIDCATETWRPVPLPDGFGVVVVHSGEHRTLAGSAYAERRAAVEEATARLGPLPLASLADVETLDDRRLAARARHVVTEVARVRRVVDALGAGDGVAAGAAMDESHRSLATDFEVSTPALDALAARLRGTPGVHGARLTGAGFGGCVVALVDAGAGVGNTVRRWSDSSSVVVYESGSATGSPSAT